MEREQELVELFADRRRELDALRGLCGGVTATRLRQLQLSAPAYRAITTGVSHRNPRVRWWCLQVLDHVGESRAVAVVAGALTDPVPRVRRNAAHALGCLACKPADSAPLPDTIVDSLSEVATSDPNPKVRAEAVRALAARATSQAADLLPS